MVECPLDDHMRALVLAAREAMVNAARHSGAPVIAVYLEVEARHRSRVFVRDRGRGFDLASVPNDRGGIAESITGSHATPRWHRRRSVASAATGTEVELSMRRSRP